MVVMFSQEDKKGTHRIFTCFPIVCLFYSLSISYNKYESYKGQDTAVSVEQDTTAINIGYTIGGMTIGFQDAQTDGAGYAADTKDDTRTIGVSVAF